MIMQLRLCINASKIHMYSRIFHPKHALRLWLQDPTKSIVDTNFKALQRLRLQQKTLVQLQLAAADLPSEQREQLQVAEVELEKDVRQYGPTVSLITGWRRDLGKRLRRCVMSLKFSYIQCCRCCRAALLQD